ncbi:uncharacterized protein MYCGRDRAFT_91665 [Zymoseptoria tritici IPO323]|uniref:SMP-30/Gluconolactonase/LRE-like region domain-containing protein n=1 Tax=Zymoseptoria tritici (strain CBS 115943 / IPO323) TaxID=336722 RepID=F9X7T5_ZYMTI|nr:uncharacterized protein MYCGRDRAFT_91665 [Zymoseptoria tritici IPO323]EGP89425.1 hypothetical protein MYCGRDRAFT_91665 [Zymoseptoria tritici IPO323]
MVFAFPPDARSQNVDYAALTRVRILASGTFCGISADFRGVATAVSATAKMSGWYSVIPKTLFPWPVKVGEYSVSEVSGKEGSWSIWSLDFSGGSVKASKITAIPAASFLNGLTSLSSKGIVLAADSAQGVVYRIDTVTGKSSVAIDSAALKPNASATYHLGVNGIHVHGPYLYFDNAGQSPLLGRFTLSADGTSSESAEVIVEDPTFPVNDKYYGFDDFTFDGSGNVWLATNPSKQIVRISPEGVATVEAGSLDDTTLQGCTSLQFGRTASDRNVLYVNVNGAGGKLVAVNTSE